MYTLDWAPMGAFFGTRIIPYFVFFVHITRSIRHDIKPYKDAFQ